MGQRKLTVRGYQTRTHQNAPCACGNPPPWHNSLMNELNQSAFTAKPAPAPAGAKSKATSATIAVIVFELVRIALDHFFGITLPL